MDDGCAGRNTVTPSSPRDPNHRSPGNVGRGDRGRAERRTAPRQPRDCGQTCFGRNSRRGTPPRIGFGRHADAPPPECSRARKSTATGEPGQVAPSRFAAPHRASTLRPDATTGLPATAPCPGRMRPKQEKRTPMDRRRTPSGGRDRKTRKVLGHEWSSRKSPRARTATSEKARQNHQANVMKTSHWMWYLASALVVDTPSGAGAGRVGGIRTPAGQLAGLDASHEGGSVRDARTRKPSWFASEAGFGPRKHRRPRTPRQSGRASARKQSTEKALRRPDRWTSDDPFVTRAGL
jgi:hypothetical protein